MKCLVPILLYGSELRALNDTAVIESVYIFSLNNMLQVPILTSNVMLRYREAAMYAYMPFSTLSNTGLES